MKGKCKWIVRNEMANGKYVTEYCRAKTKYYIGLDDDQRPVRVYDNLCEHHKQVEAAQKAKYGDEDYE